MEICRREERERLEREMLSPLAVCAGEGLGRRIPLEPDGLRTCFQRDRDRIIHCKAFRRLSHKTQVFLAAEGDHYRTRLTHTLEVAQISRTIARALKLNEDLTEAIALGHDLGHTPFGHIGEQALSYCIGRHRGIDGAQSFSHNVQSLRVVEVLENDGMGLDLSREVCDGILHHTGSQRAHTLEGRIVATSDRIAYVNHDIDDAIRGGIIAEEDIPVSIEEVLGTDHSARITTLVNDMVETSASCEDIRLSAPVWEAMDALRDFLFQRVYTSSAAKTEEPKAYGLVVALVEHYLDHIELVPADIRAVALAHPSAMLSEDPDATAVIDYVAGMTDRFARQTYIDLFIPQAWGEGR